MIIAPNSHAIPTGTVILRNGRSTLKTVRIDSSGIVIFEIDTDILGPGRHNLIAYYAGDSNFAPSASAVLVIN